MDCDPIDYVKNAFDEIIVPSLFAPTPTKLSLRIHIYRRMVLSIANSLLSKHPYHSAQDYADLAITSIEKAGLLI